MKKEINFLLAIGIMVVVAGGAFYGGLSYQKSVSVKARSNFAGRAANGRVQGQGFQAGQQRPVSGQIISLDDKSITVKMRDGSSRIVLIGDKTVIAKSAVGSKSDLAQNAQVGVTGTQNSDGSLTAQSIDIQPEIVK
ncbi:MAG: DUF5666 domain-containing protein [Candidatus Berkelbacteria bacterium]